MNTPVPVFRNDWSRIDVPDLPGWRPELSVSVIIPAFQCQTTLDLTLASLSRQTYPADLLEVVVVDDGSDPPLVLPDLRPERTTLVRVGSGWGRANALHHGVARSTGRILHWLDADMVAYPEHVAAQARWHHTVPYAVTLGYKRFVDPERHGPWPAATTIAKLWDHGQAAQLFGGEPGEPHDYVERYISQTDHLRAADHLAYRIHVGATAALRRELYDAAGGFDVELRLGEDTEFGYRLAQAGAVFVPEPEARSWHLGRTQVMRAQERVARYNRPFLADRIPYPRHWRKVGGPIWSVPLVEAVVVVGSEPLERVRVAVDSVLRGTDPDVRVSLVAPWHTLDGSRVPALADPRLDLRLLAASYRGEARVRLVTEPPASGFPAPFLLELPASYGLAPDALRRLVGIADRHQSGVVEIAAPAGGPPARLWRTAATARAGWVRSGGESTLDLVGEVFGSREITAEVAGVTDLSRFTPEQLAASGSRLVGAARGGPGLVPTTVEVEGVRSWVRATAVVAWLGGRRLASWLRLPTRRRPGRS